jgi:hypothetical protein
MFLKTEILWDVVVCHGVSSFQKGYLKNIGNRPSDKSRTSHNTCSISNKAVRSSGLASNVVCDFKYQVTLFIRVEMLIMLYCFE